MGVGQEEAGPHELLSFSQQGAVSDYFQNEQYEKMFSNRNSLEAHAKGFWDYHSFITASAHFQPFGFGGHKVTTKEQLDWSLCNNKEMNSNSDYCDEHYKNAYPCAPGVAYYGRGALPIYWNYNYGKAKYIEQNSTLAFQVAIWKWMKPIKKHQPSTHDVFTGYWTPTKNDTLAKRVSGFVATMNVLYGDLVCGKGDNESMNNIISHYLSYLDLMGVGREEAGPHDVLSCAKQA
ncbi:chitinase-like protein 2 [Quercus suber]|uniref:Chitinase-like protein 2 n=1 Tax=Quercus suber TaxID=58331 RepID=A0AAW0IS88_QUESU